ncbi:pyruvate dehydrogenase (acetyl-transferring) E1 component subunit alpha [Longispora albida]|uniref:pyruvate dehydrogenase (acetyl-transferring) E1 component subunit alpha n=1 Tax=Longispora albida TaxID=203523 RepID=UPI00037E3B72|nr:pyruvate dehydrogenase (acetyl-transferring) E1 component subunit alpha [Longispora albida]
MTTTSTRGKTPRATAKATRTSSPEAKAASALLPAERPIRFLDEHGARVDEHSGYAEPPVELLAEAYRKMVVGRRFDQQCTALTKQGRLAVYPSSHGQEACQVGGVLALRADDWMFPTYRESVAITTRGVDPVETLTLLRGDWHCGYDAAAWRTAPQCTPLATQTIHAAGVAYGEKRKGNDSVALAFIGDGATSEGDFHEAMNFAAVFRAPAIFLVQNNGYAISVPLDKQTQAPALAYKGVGYGVRSERVDGNDPVAVLAVMLAAVEHGRAGHGPFLIEAHTYRMDAHTNADDATRYREPSEVDDWRSKDPIARLGAYLRAAGALDDARDAEIKAEAEAYAASLRERMNADPVLNPLDLFEHVYATPTPQLAAQRAQLAAELEAENQ